MRRFVISSSGRRSFCSRSPFARTIAALAISAAPIASQRTQSRKRARRYRLSCGRTSGWARVSPGRNASAPGKRRVSLTCRSEKPAQARVQRRSSRALRRGKRGARGERRSSPRLRGNTALHRAAHSGSPAWRTMRRSTASQRGSTRWMRRCSRPSPARSPQCPCSMRGFPFSPIASRGIRTRSTRRSQPDASFCRRSAGSTRLRHGTQRRAGAPRQRRRKWSFSIVATAAR